MKKFFLLLLGMLLSTFCINGKNIEPVDSIRILGWQYGIIESNDYMFIRDFKDSKRIWDEFGGVYQDFNDTVNYFPVAYVDTLIISQSEILSICKEMSKLKRCRIFKKKSYDTNHLDLLIDYYNHEDRRINWDSRDVFICKLLIILFKNGKTDFIWLNELLAEIGCYTYKISDRLGVILSKYTHLYDKVE